MEIAVTDFTGLADTNSDLSAVPEGSATVADNIVLNKFNLLEPRAGYQKYSLLNYPTPDVDAKNWDSDIGLYDVVPNGNYTYYMKFNAQLIQAFNNSQFNMITLADKTDFRVLPLNTDTNLGTPKLLIVNTIPYLFSNGNNETPATAYEIVEPKSNLEVGYIRKAGIYAPIELTTQDYDTTGIFTANSMVAYRACFVQKQSNNAEISGAFSPRRDHTFTASNRKCLVRISFKKGDINESEVGRMFVQLYRTNTETTLPGSDNKLAYERAVTVEDLALGYIEIIDNTGDLSLGVSSYISLSSVKDLANKLPPPKSVSQAFFKDRLFLGGTKNDQPEYNLSLIGVAQTALLTTSTVVPPWAMSLNITSQTKIGNNLFIGINNGAIYKFDGTTYTLLGNATSEINCITYYRDSLIVFAASTGAGARTYRYSFATNTLTLLTDPTQNSSYEYYHSATLLNDDLYYVASGTNPYPMLCKMNPSFVQSVDSNWGNQTVLSHSVINNDAMTVVDYGKLMGVASSEKCLVTVGVSAGTLRLFSYRVGAGWSLLGFSTGYTLPFARVKSIRGGTDIAVYVYGTSNFTKMLMIGRNLVPFDLSSVSGTWLSAGTQNGIFDFTDEGGSFVISSYSQGGNPSYTFEIVPETNTSKLLFTGVPDNRTSYHTIYNGYIYIYNLKASAAVAYYLRRPYGALEIGDIVSVNGVLLKAAAADSYPANEFRIEVANPSLSVRITTTARSLISAINACVPNVTAEYASTVTGLPGKILLKGRDAIAPYDIYSNRNASFEPSLNVGNKGFATNNTEFNKVVYSDPYNAHAFPLGNFLGIGSSDDKILAMEASKNTLFVVKERSVWAIRGNGTIFDTEMLDDTAHCISPESVRLVNGNIYFLSNRGLARCSDTGVVFVGQQISKQVETQPVADFADAYAFAVEKNSWYCLCFKNSLKNNKRTILIYNTLLDRFFTLSLVTDNVMRGTVIQDPTTKNDHIALFTETRGNGISFFKERIVLGANSHLQCYDNSFDATVTSVISGVYNVSCAPINSNLDYIKLGDFVYQNGIRGQVFNKNVVGYADGEAGLTIEWESPNAPSTSPLKIEVLYASTYTFNPQYAGSSSLEKSFQAMYVYYQNDINFYQLWNFSNERINSPEVRFITPRSNVLANNGNRQKTLIPANVAKSNSLTFSLVIQNNKTKWSINSIVYEIAGGTNK